MVRHRGATCVAKGELMFQHIITTDSKISKWAAAQPDRTARGLVKNCPRGDWLLYLARETGVVATPEMVRPAVQRAVLYAARVADSEGYCTAAETLRSLDTAAPVPPTTIGRALRKLERQVPRDRNLSRALERAAEAAFDMGTVVKTIATGERDFSRLLYGAAQGAADTAALLGSEAEAREHALCADEIRAALGAQLVEAAR